MSNNNNNNNNNSNNTVVSIAAALLPCGALMFDPAILHDGEKDVIVRSTLDPRLAVLPRDYINPSVIVHDGVFHADDALCVALLGYYYDEGEMLVERTRDKEGYALNDLIVDVGEGLLDHHGPRAENGVAACTHVFQLLLQTHLEYYGCDTTSYRWLVEEVLPLVRKVAAQDTGNEVDNHPFPWLAPMAEYARRAGREDIMFNCAVDRIISELNWRYENFRAREASAAATDDVITAGIEDDILIFNPECRDADIKRLMHSARAKAKYYISPESADDWRIRCSCNPAQEFSYFGSWKPIPEKYCGLRGDALSAATGIPGGIFCHAAGFIAGFRTKEAAIEFARLCLTCE